jgi:branched-chain amino acid transport system permease protein
MVVLGGMGNIPGVILGALAIYFLEFKFLIDLPKNVVGIADYVGLGFLNTRAGDWPGLGDMVQRLNFLVLGLILVLMMLLRPQGILPSRVRAQELAGHGVTDETPFDTRAGQT